MTFEAGDPMKPQANSHMTAEVFEASDKPNRIQVVFNRPLRIKQPDTLAELVRATAHPPLLALFEELEHLIGLQEAKQTIYEIYAFIRMNREREKHQLKVSRQMYHMVFKGNPGTGKTTVARLFGKIFKELGMLTKGHLIEVERADLVGEFIGHTAQKTRDLVKKALGGVLFIDEAYSLARGGEKDFGKEAIDCLTKSLEDYGDQFVCIIAGYNEEMDAFLELNPGMPSRFPVQITFSDYSVDELIEIARLMAQKREYELSKEALEKMRRALQEIVADPFLHNFSNARYIRNCLEKAIRNQAVRLLKATEPSVDELMRLTGDDFTFPPA